MSATQKCLALTAIVLVAVATPAVAISAFTFPLFGDTNSQNVRQVALDGASLQEQDENGVVSGTCSFEDESGRTIEVTYTKDQYGSVNAQSRTPGVRNPVAAYHSCIQRVEQLKRQSMETAGVYNDTAQETTQPPAFPSLSGPTSQSSFPRSSNSGQTQMVFQTSNGNSMQFQENTNSGITTGICSYVDILGRTIKVSYTKHADGKVDVVTDPEVWHPKRAYRTCVTQAKKEERRLNAEMAETEADIRQQEQEMQSEMEKAFGRRKHSSAFPVARRKLQRVRDF